MTAPIRSLLRSGLTAIGLAPATHVRALAAETERHRATLEQAREDASTWKARADELDDKARQADALAARLEKAERRAERADLYLSELREARARIERAEKAIALSREHLMATEAKLDLVEAAIGVLDQRTRG